jgi:hypothetical protein
MAENFVQRKGMTNRVLDDHDERQTASVRCVGIVHTFQAFSCLLSRKYWNLYSNAAKISCSVICRLGEPYIATFTSMGKERVGLSPGLGGSWRAAKLTGDPGGKFNCNRRISPGSSADMCDGGEFVGLPDAWEDRWDFWKVALMATSSDVGDGDFS